MVGVQPFGGEGLSGTGPKAGGPLYLRRLTRGRSAPVPRTPIALPGPTGESNTLEFHPRGVVACAARDLSTLLVQAKAALASGNTVVLRRDFDSLRVREILGDGRIALVDKFDPAAIDALLQERSGERARRLRAQFAAATGALVPIVAADASGHYDPARLVVERSVTVNTAAAGGNAALLSLAEDAESSS